MSERRRTIGFAAEVRGLRRRLGWTQARLAAALGVAANTVARWERGERAPRSADAIRIALAAIEGRGQRGAMP